nr:P24 [Passion fruit green spot virus]
MDPRFLRGRSLVTNVADKRERLKSKASFSLLSDIQQILLRYIQKPYVLLMYACVLVLFAMHIDAGTHDILDDLAQQFPNNPVIEWARGNFFRLCGALVFIPVITDAQKEHQLYFGMVIGLFLLGFPQRSIFEYFVYSLSLHVYAKSKHPMTRIFILVVAVTSCVLFGVFTNEQLKKLYQELPKVPTHPVNKVEKVVNRVGGQQQFQG